MGVASPPATTTVLSSWTAVLPYHPIFDFTSSEPSEPHPVSSKSPQKKIPDSQLSSVLKKLDAQPIDNDTPTTSSFTGLDANVKHKLLAVRGTDLFVASTTAKGRIRVLNLKDLKSAFIRFTTSSSGAPLMNESSTSKQKHFNEEQESEIIAKIISAVPYSEISFGSPHVMDFKIRALVIDFRGDLMIVHGDRQVVLVVLPPVIRGLGGMMLGANTGVIDCRSIPVGEYYHATDSYHTVVDVKWYPLSEKGSVFGVLSSNSCLRLYDANKSLQEPIQTHFLFPRYRLHQIPTKRSFGADMEEAEAVAFEWGNPFGQGWEPFTVLCLAKNGDLFSCAPIVVDDSVITSTQLTSLRLLVHTMSAHFNERQCTVALKWIEEISRNATRNVPRPGHFAHLRYQQPWINATLSSDRNHKEMYIRLKAPTVTANISPKPSKPYLMKPFEPTLYAETLSAPVSSNSNISTSIAKPLNAVDLLLITNQMYSVVVIAYDDGKVLVGMPSLENGGVGGQWYLSDVRKKSLGGFRGLHKRGSRFGGDLMTSEEESGMDDERDDDEDENEDDENDVEEYEEEEEDGYRDGEQGLRALKANPVLPVYEVIDLGLLPRRLENAGSSSSSSSFSKPLKSGKGSTEEALPPSFVLSLYCDPKYPSIVYVSHDQGVHCIDMSEWMVELESLFMKELDTGMDENVSAYGENDARQEEILEVIKVESKGRKTLVSEMVRSVFSGDDDVCNPITGVAIITDIYLGYSSIFLSANSTVVSTELSLQFLSLSSLTDLSPSLSSSITKQHEDANASFSATSLPPDTQRDNLCPIEPFVLPDWIKNWKRPILMKGATNTVSSNSSSSTEIDEAALKSLASHVENLRNTVIGIEDLSEDLQTRFQLHQSVLSNLFKTRNTLQEHVSSTLEPSQGTLETKLERVKSRQGKLTTRADILLQMCMDRLRGGELSAQERLWIRNIHKWYMDVSEQTKRVDQMGMQFARLGELLKGVRSEAEVLEERFYKDGKSEGGVVLGESQKVKIERMLQTEFQLLADTKEKVDKLVGELGRMEI